MVSIEISGVLDWAVVILEFAATWVWIFCILIAAWILWKGAIESADDLVKGSKKKGRKRVSRTKE